ncbi:sugar kinase [Planomonospora parontospora]|uniref:sugar kinase n=1 Tax=Planomonospora parontospora TaxID=58119 RepID=UPI001670BAA6|nr:sugar kinase [Planomonospora parontospora]GGL43637.1 sugar kinase [Planomonospora parontospora subsp. antibiotica]GII18452.1 sugar kinase [Planomonospora parontospora subsp. antibiotica]
MTDLVTLGETMALFTARRTGLLRHARDFDLGVGGAESNAAIGVTRLGLRAAWIGRVGADEFGELVRSTLAGEHVDVSRTVVDPDAPTGLMVKGRRTSEAVDVRYYRAASAGSRLCPDDLDPELIRSARVLHVTGITPALSASAREAVRAAVAEARAAGVPVSMDVNYRRALWPPDQAAAMLRETVEAADVLFATEAEARLFVGGQGAPGGDPAEPARALAALGPRHVLVKLGARGALELSDGEVRRAEPYRVTELDPVGAGDAFAAGWLADWLGGASPERRLATACAAGACAVTAQGDWESLPRRADLELLRLTGTAGTADAVDR